jgi:hypothetical protein
MARTPPPTVGNELVSITASVGSRQQVLTAATVIAEVLLTTPFSGHALAPRTLTRLVNFRWRA